MGSNKGGGGCTFTCTGCREVELGEFREMLVGMTRTVTGQGLEEEGGKTGDRVVGPVEQENDLLAPDNSLAEENRNGRATAGHISSEDRDTVI